MFQDLEQIAGAGSPPPNSTSLAPWVAYQGESGVSRAVYVSFAIACLIQLGCYLKLELY